MDNMGININIGIRDSGDEDPVNFFYLVGDDPLDRMVGNTATDILISDLEEE